MLFTWTVTAFVVGSVGTRRYVGRQRMVSMCLNNNAFNDSLQTMGFSSKLQSDIQTKLNEVGIESISELVLLARDFTERSEVFSDLLQSDFGFNPVLAHRTRAVVMDMLKRGSSEVSQKVGEASALTTMTPGHGYKAASNDSVSLPSITLNMSVDTPEKSLDANHSSSQKFIIDNPDVKKLLYKKVIVNEQAQRRHKKSHLDGNQHGYGLPSNYTVQFPQLAKELDEFYSFMTRPSTASQEEHIRPATATVYVRHAKLFLGWYVNQGNRTTNTSLSLFSIVPNKEKESADNILEFVLWLRSTRSTSVSYEANVLRGIAKLIKFRFAKESKADPTYGDKAFDDIPMIREIRKLHRDANKRQTMAPRSSDENQKWLSWPEYLQVVRSVQADLLLLLNTTYNDGKLEPNADANRVAGRKIATVYQYYLILAFFASVPDRQRTIRELELGRSFIKDTKQNLWTIKHSPEDYKTGKTYGERPSLTLAPALVPAIDDFIEKWRPFLLPITDVLFVQPRTGKPLTQDSVYQIVARNCYTYTGKRTNPHLLRDMIVTHVKESDASEKELEALALYMGHSVNMQRNSYDRRSLAKKVAPAVELIYNINKLSVDG